MKFFKIILSIIVTFTIGSIYPMKNNSNSLPPQRPTVPAPQMPSSPQRPLVPAPQRSIPPTPNQTIPHNEQFDTNPPQRALPTIPQKPLPTPPSKKNPIQLTKKSFQQNISRDVDLEPTTASSSTQPRQSNSLPPQRTLPTIPLASSFAPSSAQGFGGHGKASEDRQDQMESTTASSSTQPRQSDVYTPTKYDEIFNIITTMDPQNILVNNRFTDPFIDFIKSQGLSHKEINDLLEFIIPLYMTPINSKEKNEQIILSLKKSINQKSAAPNIPTQKHFTTHNLIMLLDPEKTETINGTARLLVQDALVALYEQAAPIIMSSNILEIITTLRHMIGEKNLQILRNSNKSESFAQNLLASYNLHENPLHLIILSLIDFNSKNFIFYFHRSEDLILIIPQQYITDNIEDASQFNFQDQAKKCGFNPAMTTPINDLSADNLFKQLNIQETSQHKTTFIHNLTSLFISQKNDGQLITPAETTPWIIYLGGHGGALYQSIGSIREQLDINQQNLAFYQEVLQNNRKRHDAQKNIIFAETNIKKYEKILQGKSDWPDSQLVIGQANIAGITMDDFLSLMTFFDQNLYVYYVHYTSCLDGGYKQTVVNETLSSLNVNFIVSTQGLDERKTTGVHLEVTFNSKAPYIVIAKKPFSAFFKVLKIFIEQPEAFAETKRGKKEQEPFAYVLSALVSNMDHHNQPFIRFPGAGVFGALSLGKKTKNITNALIKAHEIEKRPINLSDTNIDLVTITPSRINASLNFGKNMHCAIISPTPSAINAAHEAIHLFKEIHFENPLQALIFNFITFNARIHPQTFIVKKVTGISIGQNTNNTINNLIIHIQYIPGETVRARLEIAFEFNGNIYQCTTEIKNFEDPHMANFIYSLNFAPTTDIQSLSHKFLTPQEIKKLKQPITLESIIQLVDKKIDTQQPSLKDTAVKKEFTEFIKQMPK